MRFAACLVIAAACYGPSFPEGAPCSVDPDCPPPQRCVAGTCAINPGGMGDDAGDAADSTAGDDLPFIPKAMQFGGGAGLTITGAATLDTTTLTFTGGLPIGVELVASQQKVSGEVAILRVASLDVSSTGTLTVVGTRPLAILSVGGVTIDGVVDASGRGSAMGPGAPATSGAGGDGVPTSGTIDDSGAGGGGNATAGAKGGDSNTPMPGGAGGAVIDQPQVLVGGGRGGTGSTRATCMPAAGGGGGGAIYIYSPSTISIHGRIAVNGGGGEGGPPCPADNALGPAGGGAGGRLELQAPVVSSTSAAIVVANGGGGGGGSSSGNAGLPGADGRADATPAAGGLPPGSLGGMGGNGGAGALAPTSGVQAANGGGGGGAVGRIHIRYRVAPPTISASPPATLETY
jgi:hypothetical protein